MSELRVYRILKIVFSIFMVVSAIGEVSMNETVVHSMYIINMPPQLLYLLGIFKVLGVLAIWISPYNWLKEWAYAGFVFDFLGAIFLFIIMGQFPIPDIIMAPLALIICLLTYLSWKKQQKNNCA